MLEIVSQRGKLRHTLLRFYFILIDIPLIHFNYRFTSRKMLQVSKQFELLSYSSLQFKMHIDVLENWSSWTRMCLPPHRLRHCFLDCNCTFHNSQLRLLTPHVSFFGCLLKLMFGKSILRPLPSLDNPWNSVHIVFDFPLNFVI